MYFIQYFEHEQYSKFKWLVLIIFDKIIYSEMPNSQLKNKDPTVI